MNSLEFDDLSYEQLQAFIESGKIDDIPTRLVEYLGMLEMIRELYDKYHKQPNFIINLLKMPPYSLSEYKANKLFSDTLNFFYCKNDVKADAWANIYADKFDKLALLCLVVNNFEGAKDNWQTAAKFRGVGKDKPNVIPQELLDRRVIIYTSEPEKLKLPKVNRKKLAAWIDKLDDIDMSERERLHQDAQTGENGSNFLNIEAKDIEFVDDEK